MCRTVTLEYEDGTKREVKPEAWEDRGDSLPPRPVFHPSPYRIVETVDGRYLAIRDRTE